MIEPISNYQTGQLPLIPSVLWSAKVTLSCNTVIVTNCHVRSSSSDHFHNCQQHNKIPPLRKGVKFV